jgi:hypothetical protein
MADQVKYYLTEDTNQILVSGSATRDGMNALLTSSKAPLTLFNANTTAKIVSLGTAVSYQVQNGTADSTIIPIADNQELWVYRGLQTIGTGDANAYKYNPQLHRPYKAYILTETGSGTPIEPWLPVGNPINYNVDTSITDIPSKYGEQQIAAVGNVTGSITPNAISGSFTVFNAQREIHPFAYTKYTTVTSPPVLGAYFTIWQENFTQSFLPFTFDSTVAVGNPGLNQISLNNLNPLLATTASIYSRLDNSATFNDLITSLNDSRKTWLEISSTATPSNFIRYQISSLESFEYFYTVQEWWEATILNSTSSVGFTPFTNNESINYAVSSSLQMGTVTQTQYYSPNSLPENYDSITLGNGIYSYTSSNFDVGAPFAGLASSGSTQFGLYCDYGYYVQYLATLNNGASPVRIDFTGSTLQSNYFELQPGFNASYTALVGTVSASSANLSTTTFSNIITSPNAGGNTPQNSFTTRVNDVYISFSSSLSQSIDGLYIFNQLPQSDIQVTASMFLNAWTGSDDGAKYGIAVYSASNYGEGEDGGGPTWPTASMRFYTGSYPNEVPTTSTPYYTQSIFSSSTIHTNGLAITMSCLIPSSSISIKDCFSVALAVSSGSAPSSSVENSLIVSQYDLKFFTPTQSQEGDGRVPTFIDNAFSGSLGFSNAPDCQPLLNNVDVERPNPQIQLVDYTTDLMSPVNFQQILTGSAEKSTVPESNYTQNASINVRYLGSKIQANNVNSIEGLSGNFGTIPVIDYKRAYFAYCDQVIDLYPIINNKTLFNIKYLINEGGDALQPNLSPYTAFDVEGTWDEGGLGRIGINQISGSTQFDQLNNLQPIYKVAKLPQPVLYSQTGAKTYASLATTQSIPLAGNPNRVSSYNPAYCQYGMSLVGSTYTVQNQNTKTIDLNNIGSGITGSSNAPTTQSIYKIAYGYSGSGSTQKWVESSIITGSVAGLPGPDTYGLTYTGQAGMAYFTTDPFTSGSTTLTGNQLSDNWKFKLKYTQPSTPPNGYRTDAGGWNDSSDYNTDNVGQIYVYLQKSTNGTTWVDCQQEIVESPKMICYWQGGQTEIINLPDVLGANVAGLRNNNKLLYIQINPTALANTIAQRGKNYGDVIYVNFVIFNQNAASEQLVANTQYRWASSLRYAGEPVDAPRNYWNPTVRPEIGGNQPIFPPVQGPFIQATIQGTQPGREGSDDAINSPYWAFSQSGVFDLIQLQDENGNAAYDEGYFQGYLPYTASINNVFPGGLEPADTAFPLSNIIWNVQVNDEIRFENNESKVFKVTEVIPPGESSNGKLKLKLDGNIPPSTNKDFFLLRRYVYSPNSVVIDRIFPYGALPVTKEFIPSVNTETKFSPATGPAYPLTSSAFQSQSGSFVTTYAPLTKLANTPAGILYPEYPTALIDLETDSVINTLRNNKLIT